MEHEDRKFCVGINVDDETVLWDNYQREEIDSVLQGYLTETYGLPPVYRAETITNHGLKLKIVGGILDFWEAICYVEKNK